MRPWSSHYRDPGCGAHVTEQTSNFSVVTRVAATILARSKVSALCFLTLRNGAESFLQLRVLQMFNKFRNFYVTHLFITFFHEDSPFAAVLSQINPVYTLQFYSLKICFIYFTIYDLGLINSLFPSFLPNKTPYALSFTSYTKHILPISSSLLKI